MARIRTIKPAFFTSEDIVSLSPLARLLYVGVWCEADREGRLLWRPRTLKLRYLPGDNCDAEALAAELVSAGLVVPYEVEGQQLAHIPTFIKHQIVNNRETASTLPPPPHASATCAPRVPHASATRHDHAEAEQEGNRKGTGREQEHAAEAGTAAAGAADGSVLLDLSGDLPAMDFKAHVFAQGPELLGLEPAAANKVIGRWLGQVDAEALADILAKCKRARPSNPTAWITSVVKGESGKSSAKPPRTFDAPGRYQEPVL